MFFHIVCQEGSGLFFVFDDHHCTHFSIVDGLGRSQPRCAVLEEELTVLAKLLNSVRQQRDRMIESLEEEGVDRKMRFDRIGLDIEQEKIVWILSLCLLVRCFVLEGINVLTWHGLAAQSLERELEAEQARLQTWQQVNEELFDWLDGEKVKLRRVGASLGITARA